MSELYYHEITKNFLKRIKAPETTLSDQLSMVLESESYLLHLEFNHDSATLAFILKDVSISRAADWYTTLTERINTMPLQLLNIGVSILNDSSIVVHCVFPNDLIEVDRLCVFYETVDKNLLTEF